MSETQADTQGRTNSVSMAWMRALERTAPIARTPSRVLSTVIAELAAQRPDLPALLSDRERMSYGELAARANQYARWALEMGLPKGDVVGLMMTNRPEYFAVWLGITSVGGVVSLLNINLVGPSLAHCINVVGLRHLIVASEFIDSVIAIQPQLIGSPMIWTHGKSTDIFPRIDLTIEKLNSAPVTVADTQRPTIADRALYIFTSGTTGLPKAANISHARVMQWSQWFAGMMHVQPGDRMYNCLPMYHSVGGVQVPGSILASGGSVVIREKFSASQFWNDIVRWDCTMFQYIGELCRYLLHAASTEQSANHRIRIACGNGLAPDVWQEFQERFRIPHIFEFYAATEGGVALFNIEGKRGAIGHVPGYLRHRFSPALVKFDVERGEPMRNEQGFCIRCGPNEPGEAIGKVSDDPANVGARFEGYTDPKSTDRKLLRDVFEPGDIWVRTGDLMRKDEKGYFYFVDRIGDTFRWKGENVSTSEVSDVLCSFPGVQHANVYGVSVPGADGRIGMAALVIENSVDLAALRDHICSRLPSYARPAFLRIRSDIEVTGTFKYSKVDLVRQGYDPEMIADEIYFDHPQHKAFHRLDASLFRRIQAGEIPL